MGSVAGALVVLGMTAAFVAFLAPRFRAVRDSRLGDDARRAAVYEEATRFGLHRVEPPDERIIGAGLRVLRPQFFTTVMDMLAGQVDGSPVWVVELRDMSRLGPVYRTIAVLALPDIVPDFLVMPRRARLTSALMLFGRRRSGVQGLDSAFAVASPDLRAARDVLQAPLVEWLTQQASGFCFELHGQWLACCWPWPGNPSNPSAYHGIAAQDLGVYLAALIGFRDHAPLG